MQKSERFFIFSWKELVVLTLVSFTAMGFFFTLGLHYGKQLTGEVKQAEEKGANLEPSPESVPSKEVLEQGTHHAEAAAEDAIHEASEKAVADAGLKLDHPKPVDLPSEKKGEVKSAPPAVNPNETKAEAKPEVKGESKPETKAETKAEVRTEPKSETKPETKPETKVETKPEPKAEPLAYAVQLGSYPNSKDAQKKLNVFLRRGLKAEVRTAVVKGETRYRVILPGFKTAKLAEHRGKELKGSRKIESFVVIRSN